MTDKAIDILSKNDNGYVLQVEADRVDHAFHANNAYRALTDNIEFAKTVQLTLDEVNLEDTLILVTSDHGHTLAFSGYPERGNPILVLVKAVDEETGKSEVVMAQDGKPYPTLGFLKGSVSVYYAQEDEDGNVPEGAGRASQRPNLAKTKVQGKAYSRLWCR